MITKTITGQFDLNNKYYHPYIVAEKSVRSLFEAIQQAKGNFNNIRIKRTFVKCTAEHDEIQYSHKGNIVTVLERSYDAQIVINNDYVELYHLSAFWRPF